jgi:hypothetical protein
VWWMGTGASVEPAASIFMVEELNWEGEKLWRWRQHKLF